MIRIDWSGFPSKRCETPWIVPLLFSLTPEKTATVPALLCYPPESVGATNGLVTLTLRSFGL